MQPRAKLRLAFMGTPAFAVAALRTLKDAGHDIVMVYAPPPKPAGRGQHMQKSAVQIAAEDMGLAVRTPKTLRDAEEQKIFAGLKLDIAVIAVYSLILPLPILVAPKFGCLNIHPSLLPRWRGAAPIKRALLAGDRETGVTIMQLEEGLDSGPMLLQEKIPVAPAATAETLDDELAVMGARMIVEALDGLAAGAITPKPQPQEGITYAAKLTREDGRIDWTKPAADIERQIRALQPWPGAFFMLGDESVKVLAAEMVAGAKGAAGTLLADDFTVACGKDALRLVTVQRAGKSATDGASFLRGARLAEGQIL
ncbi:MAG TPA: methionyl-tRNA formyltransferase [Alphaproteobacteria bacterium]|nr:methionyl-tRNA formyltransferase [Alphaproteobacteria bacterium]